MKYALVIFGVTIGFIFGVASSHAGMLPADDQGRVQVPAIQAMADTITGGGIPAYCVPTSTEDYGWISGNEGPGIDPDGMTGPNGEDWVIDWTTTEINISGDICSQLERLTRYPQTSGYFRQHPPTPRPIKKGQKPPKQTRWDIWPNMNTYDAAVGILTLAHESFHVALQSVDEGLVECTAIQNVWPLIASLHLPAWLNKTLLLDAKSNHFDAPDQYLKVC